MANSEHISFNHLSLKVRSIFPYMHATDLFKAYPKSIHKLYPWLTLTLCSILYRDPVIPVVKLNKLYLLCNNFTMLLTCLWPANDAVNGHADSVITDLSY